MTGEEIFNNIRKKKSFLCIGLDTDIAKIPAHLLDAEDPQFEFNKQIIEATHDLCIAYKLNTAFYESEGAVGWECLEKTLRLIPQDIFTIADAKRGDIGNSSAMYAKTFFEKMDFDAVTLSPYMGFDSVAPFLSYKGKWSILLALTSNEGAKDFQLGGLFEKVMETSQNWDNADRLMYVIGATKGEQIGKARELAPHHFFLMPGAGSQGGSLKEAAEYGMNAQCGMMLNVSRSIIYAGSNKDFADKARQEALNYQREMEELLKDLL